ncbi:MAG TPA: alcohol dehydrogenase catalytic domain-containing protein [Terriglobia bacterium]
MKTALLTGIRQLEVRDAPLPELITPEDVLVQIEAVGVCGSDIHYYATGRIGSQAVQFPETLGHECAGVVAATGTAVRAPKLAVGQRVAIDPLIPCGRCDQCLAGREHTCRRQRFLGCPGQAPGALAEYLVMPARCCYPVPDSMTAAQAALVEPFSIGLHSRNLAPLPSGSEAKIAILGAGPIGLCVLLACRATDSNCRTYVTDLIDERLEVARRCGAEWTGNPQREDVVRAMAEEPLGMDVVFECAGKQETLDQATELLKPGGTLLVVGIPELDRVSFDPHLLRRHELQVRTVRRQNKCVAPAIGMIASGAVNVDALVTHRFSLAETQQAFDLVAGYGDGVMKAMVEMVSER